MALNNDKILTLVAEAEQETIIYLDKIESKH